MRKQNKAGIRIPTVVLRIVHDEPSLRRDKCTGAKHSIRMLKKSTNNSASLPATPFNSHRFEKQQNTRAV